MNLSWKYKIPRLQVTCYVLRGFVFTSCKVLQESCQNLARILQESYMNCIGLQEACKKKKFVRTLPDISRDNYRSKESKYLQASCKFLTKMFFLKKYRLQTLKEKIIFLEISCRSYKPISRSTFD